MTTIRAMKDKAYRAALDKREGNLTHASRDLGIHIATLRRWKVKNSYCFMRETGADSGQGETQ